MDRLLSMALFVAAIDEGSLVAAGRKHGLSASMAGKHVTALEASLKVRLIHRSTRKLNLTDAGKTYYLRCKQLLDDLEDANHEVSDAQGTTRGTLRIAAPVTFGELHLSGLLSRYLAENPGLTVDVSLDDRHVDLVDAGFDLAIRIGRLANDDLAARPLATCRLVLCASPEYLSQCGPLKHPSDLAAHPRLVFSQAISEPKWTLRNAAGDSFYVDGPVRMSSNNMQTLLAAARSSLGLVFGPTFVLGPCLQSGALVEVLPAFPAASLNIHAVYPGTRYVPAKVRHFIDYLVRSFSGNSDWNHRIPHP